jgi:hypothetical protein
VSDSGAGLLISNPRAVADYLDGLLNRSDEAHSTAVNPRTRLSSAATCGATPIRPGGAVENSTLR